MKHVPTRTCIVCKQQKDKPELIRLVCSADCVSVDISGKAAGRGAYVCRECLPLLKKKRALDRAFKTKIPDEVYDKLIGEAEEVLG